MKKGWFLESSRHSLAAKGIKTGRNWGKCDPVNRHSVKQVPESVEGTHFKINDKITVVARYGDSRDGFNHFADLYINGNLVDSAKVHYINRTWESYEFESVLEKLINKTNYLSKEEKEKAQKFARDYENINRAKVEKEFGQIARIAQLGEIFGSTQKEKNDWKARMLKAGLIGLEMPEDWETLDEDTKQARLDAVIKEMKGKKEVK